MVIEVTFLCEISFRSLRIHHPNSLSIPAQTWCVLCFISMFYFPDIFNREQRQWSSSILEQIYMSLDFIGFSKGESHYSKWYIEFYVWFRGLLTYQSPFLLRCIFILSNEIFECSVIHIKAQDYDIIFLAD